MAYGLQCTQSLTADHGATMAQLLHQWVSHQLHELVEGLAQHLRTRGHSSQQERREQGSVIGRDVGRA